MQKAAHAGQKEVTQNADEQQNTTKDVVSSSLPESPKEKDKDTVETTDGTFIKSETAKQVLSPDKRVTRSTTGNLKPKQPFDEIQEKVELKSVKRKEASTQRSKQKKDIKGNGQSEGEGNKDEKPAVKAKTPGDHETSDDLSSDDDEIDFHEDDSDYSPEDDPDRLWCICRKPHGNKYVN